MKYDISILFSYENKYQTHCLYIPAKATGTSTETILRVNEGFSFHVSFPQMFVGDPACDESFDS